MSKSSNMVYKTLVVGVIVLFIGVGIQPAFAIEEPKEEIIDIEPKDCLFQTIVDIANNPEVKKLLKQYDDDLFKVDIDRSIYRKIFLRNPRLFFNTLFTKPSLSIEYLDKCYNKGIEITNIFGEDKVIEMIESIEVTDTRVFDELNNIISKDEELSNRLATLKEMNKESNFDWDYPIICSITFVLTTGIWFIAYGIALFFAGLMDISLAMSFNRLATFFQEIGWMLVSPFIVVLFCTFFINFIFCYDVPVP